MYSRVIWLYIHMYISLFFFLFFSTVVYYKILNIVPCAIQKNFVVYFIFDNVHLLIPYSQFIPSSS